MYTTRGYRDGSTSISRFPIYVALPPCSVILFMKPHKAFSLFAFESSRGREFFHNFFLSAAQSVFGFVIQVWIYITSKLAFANKISAAISHRFKFSICSHKLEAGGRLTTWNRRFSIEEIDEMSARWAWVTRETFQRLSRISLEIFLAFAHRTRADQSSHKAVPVHCSHANEMC